MLKMVQEDPTFVALYNYTKALAVALGHRDLLTRLHSDRVLGLAGEIAVVFGMSEKDLAILKIAALFHDIGKIGIPDNILLKPSKLDEVEWEKMKEHSAIGENIMSAIDIEDSPRAAKVIRHHHEYYNGLGYPDKLIGEDIPICSRIISIADSYDAMAITRSYHKARKHSEIISILESETGEKHDPNLMQIFCKIIETSKFKAASN
jgi:HD-GYP domain-containing protein (c-di-GMP phosphodiesterase class II)